MPCAMTPIVGYWDVRGLAQPIRNLLIYQGVEFEDKRYKFGPEPDFDREEWLGEKPTLGLRFPNLPYYFDDDVKVTQSLAIVRYLARKHDLAARDEEETLELDMLEQHARDLLWGLMMAIASPNYEETRPKYEEKMESLLQPWDEQLQEKEWVIGDRVTYVDFLLYEALDWNYELNAAAFEGFPALTAYTKRFEELPNIDEYFGSDKYNKYPMLGPMFQWGFEKE
ncbi:glutathione S-transferase-like isoform X1 [Dermacentor albipictus]|uniref:glutathione S-transferase-like isoform X1 n=2 Tax=Dermacentor albipictus TaxID=60249 RepID=UPI0038FCF47A